MPDFRRYYVPRAVVFITSVTHDRRHIFDREENVSLLFETMRNVQAIRPYDLLAYVILPDHLHFLMRTDTKTNFSQVMKSINWNYTRNYKKAHRITTSTRLWQARFWDHIIRDERDLATHFDYIHYNPVKHGHALRPEDWSRSTYGHWLESGYYEVGWGHSEPETTRGVSWE